MAVIHCVDGKYGWNEINGSKEWYEYLNPYKLSSNNESNNNLPVWFLKYVTPITLKLLGLYLVTHYN